MHRNIAIAFCVLQLLISGCISAAVTRNHTLKPPVRTATARLPLSDYIRTVYKISEEGALEREEDRQKVLQSHPELAELAHCVAVDSVNMECRIKLADGYVGQALLFSAYTLFNEVLKMDPDEFRATLGLARIWDQWKDYSMARRLAEAAITINPDSGEAHELMGNIQLHINMPAIAVAEFRKSIELSPDNAVTIANLGYAQMLLHSWPQAKASLEKALGLEGSLAEARNNLGIVLAQLGDYDGAIAQMQQVSGPAVAYNNLGVVLLIYKKEPVAALRAFEQALHYDPGYDKARVNLDTTRALLPASVVVNLPPRQGGGIDVKSLGSSAPVDIPSTLAEVVEQALQPDEAIDEPETVLAPVEDLGVPATNQSPSLVSVMPVDQPIRKPFPHLPAVPSFHSVSSSNIAGQHIGLYAILATLGLILITSITSRCILARIAMLQRS